MLIMLTDKQAAKLLSPSIETQANPTNILAQPDFQQFFVAALLLLAIERSTLGSCVGIKVSANIFSRGESGWSPQEGGVRHVGSLSDLGRMRLNVPRAKPLPGKQGQNKTLPLNQTTNLNQTQPKRTKPNRAGPNPFAIPCPCGLTDQGPQLTQASPLSRVRQVLPRTFGTVSDKLFKSFSFFPVDDPINGFSKFIYCQL